MVLGSATQEKWLAQMGETAHGFAPEVDVVSFKGVFRLAIAGALLDHHIDTWEALELQGWGYEATFHGIGAEACLGPHSITRPRRPNNSINR